MPGKSDLSARHISIGPGEIAGYFSRLKTGFDELGVPCEHFVMAENRFAYPESNYFLRGKYMYAAKFRAHKNRAVRLIGFLLSNCVRTMIFTYALIRCDVFIFSGADSFFEFHELFLLKLLGKKVLVIYLGSDARPPFFSGRHMDDLGGYIAPAHAYREAEQILGKIRRVERYADVIVNHTGTGQFFRRSFVRLAAVGTPIAGGTTDSPRAVAESKSVRILHAPSRPLAKGSLIFRKILDELRMEGYLLEFIELVGVPNSVVLEELQNCDFVIDELFSDVPLAMFGCEAALFAKPVVVGGYYAEQYIVDNPDAEPSVSLYVKPENIALAIRRMIEDPAARHALGQRAQNFVRSKYSVITVAENYLRLIENDIPESWFCVPTSLLYFWGWGLSKEDWRKQISRYVSTLGGDALMLDHSPRLKQRVLSEIH